MHYITLDTNTWIYLANGTEPVRILHFIKSEVEKNNIVILLPEIVENEWEIHKEKTVRQGSIKHFNEIKDSLERILKLLGDKGQKDYFSFLLDEKDEKDYFEDFLEKFKLKKREIEEAISDNIKLVDDLFKNHSTKILIKTEVYVKAGKFALEKKAPFKMKNSFADALIVFSFLDYVTKNSIEGALFISYNTDDFCEKKDGKKILHPDLVQEFDDAKSQYYKIVGEAINTIEQDIISKEELELIKQIQDEENWSYEPEICKVCIEIHSRLNAVSFGKPFELNDERLSVRINPRQQKLDFSGNTDQSIIYNSPVTIEVGHCDWCNTEHFICVDCGITNPIWDGEYNKIKECDGCGLNYFVKSSGSKDGFENIEYTIPKETITCQKCGNEFDKEDIIENICMDCEEEYSYGKE